MARKAPVDWFVGSEARTTYESNDVPPWPYGRPVEGDLMRSRAGASYVIEEVHPVRGNPSKVRLVCARLEYDSVDPEEEGVWNFVWNRR